MERRLLLVFALTFVVVIASQWILKKYQPTAPQTTQQAAPLQAPAAPAASAPSPTASSPASRAASRLPSRSTKPATELTPKLVGQLVPQQAANETETVVENELYRITFSNRGGQVKSWILKQFTDDKGGELELVNSAAADLYGYPLSLWTYDETLRNKLNSALFVVSPAGKVSAPAEISFDYSDGDVAVHKTLKFDHTYVVQVQTSVQVNGSDISAFPMWPAGFGDSTSASGFAAGKIEYQNPSTIERLAIKKISSGGTVQGPFHWAGISDQYFAAVFLPGDSQTTALVTLRNALNVPRDPKNPAGEKLKVEVLGAAVGNLEGATSEQLYVGPKSLSVLQSIPVPAIGGTEPDLHALVDYGWLGVIARPLFVWLKWTYVHIVHNWGWAIMIQTLIINLALLPLRVSQMKSMLKMQRVAPQIKSIQEKYKKYSMRDPRKQPMNEEISALYKKEGVNPAGGCLPLIIQMPFLFAYYRMLGVALELRHAPWVWVHDLSSPDPLHLLPVAIIVTMLFMQKTTPQAGMDPAQQKMMNFMMPMMLGIISWNLAAGLCLYWSVGNLIAIVQQSVMNRTELGREMREMMEKRARKAAK